ncbi:MAG TPA: 2'-5' RNA ligase family protein [Mycobacteriales bacterium]|nr:2'-5' RNA ligase family protein [Mycobacteriales bacterium]
MTRRNIGVAIEVPQPYAQILQDWRQRLGDPTAARIPPHVTLLPPTLLTDEALTDVEEHLRGVAQNERSFEMHLRGTGTFRPVSPVTFVQVAAGIADCERLESRVRHGPLDRPVRFNYHPHVTVAQDVAEEQLEEGFQALAGFDARFPVWGFSLFEQGPDRTWRPRLDFPFGRSLPGPSEGHPAPRPEEW